MGVGMTGLYQYLNGSIMMGYFVIAAFFLKFWMRTSDKLFAYFGVAFFLFGVEKILFAYNGAVNSESHAALYLVRLGGFILIILGVVSKNRGKTT